MAKVVATAPVAGTRGLTAADLGFGAREERGARLPLAQRPHKWAFAFHPDRWQVMCGRVVPMLATMFVVPGLNGVPTSGSARRAVEAREERGWTILDPMIDGEDSYVFESQSITPYGTVQPLYLSRWETAHAGSDHVSCDSEAFSAWLAGLVAAGKIAAPAPYILANLRSTLKGRVSALVDACRLTPSMSDLLDAARADLDVVEQAIKSATPKPAAKRPVASLD